MPSQAAEVSTAKPNVFTELVRHPAGDLRRLYWDGSSEARWLEPDSELPIPEALIGGGPPRQAWAKTAIIASKHLCEEIAV